MFEWNKYDSNSRACLNRGDVPGAIEWLEKAVTNAETNMPSSVALLCNRLASLYERTEQLTQAEETARKSVRMELEFGDIDRDSETLATYYMKLSRVLERKGSFLEALGLVDKAIEKFARRHEPESDFLTKVVRYRDILRENAWKG